MNVFLYAIVAVALLALVARIVAADVPVEAASETAQSGFIESFTIIFREGLEAILIIAALIAYLVTTKNNDKVKTIYIGAGMAILASIATAFILNAFFSATDAPQEMLEGTTMLIAAIVMLYVTNWFLGKMDSKKWSGYIRGKMDDALTSGSTMALGLVSFLAVYREGFETVLFYGALTSGQADVTGMLGGFLAGLAVLAVVFVLIVKLETRLPLNVVFGVTSAILFLLSLKFAGKGIHELQEARVLPETAFNVVPKMGDLGIYPTIETIGIQALVIVFGLGMLYLHFYANTAKVQAKA